MVHTGLIVVNLRNNDGNHWLHVGFSHYESDPSQASTYPSGKKQFARCPRQDLRRGRLGENDPSRNQGIPKGFIGMNLATAQGTLGDVVA